MMKSENSILIVSQRQAFTDTISEVLPADQQTRVTIENATFAQMNGSAATLAYQNDIVIFEADPNDSAGVDSIAKILENRKNGTFFLALTDSDISIEKARLLRKVGVDEVLPKSITQPELRSIIDATLARNNAERQTSVQGVTNGSLIAIAQARGGIGSTTIAVNLAHCLLGHTGVLKKTATRSVVLVDLDIQFGNVNVFLDLEDNGGMARLLEGGELPDADFMSGIVQKHASGMDILNAPAHVEPLESLQPEMIAAMLDCLRAQYDYVIVDLPRAMVDWIEPILKQASSLLIVSDTSVPCVRQARRLIDFYREEHIGLPVQVIINRETRPMMKSEHHKEAEAVLETKLLHWLPIDDRAARKAVDLGRPIVELASNSSFSKSLRKTAKDIHASMSSQKSKTA
jgi:pilus assembly protein CpaE